MMENQCKIVILYFSLSLDHFYLITATHIKKVVNISFPSLAMLIDHYMHAWLLFVQVHMIVNSFEPDITPFLDYIWYA